MEISSDANFVVTLDTWSETVKDIHKIRIQKISQQYNKGCHNVEECTMALHLDSENQGMGVTNEDNNNEQSSLETAITNINKTLESTKEKIFIMHWKKSVWNLTLFVF